jgi:Ca-activated chloride channel family protein
MTFQAVIHPVLLFLLAAPALGIAIIALVRSPGARGRWALRIAIVVTCVLLLLRPGIPGGTSTTLATETDIVLVVDTTASIVAEDWGDGRPRLDGVRSDIAALVAEYPGARVALITFDAAAEIRLPLTTDTTALISSLEVMRPEVTARSQGSSISIANNLLETTLRGAAELAPDRTRMVFYFGDGEQTASSAPGSFAGSSDLISGGAVFGYGTAEGGPMRITSGGVDGGVGDVIEYEGAPARSVIDEAALRTIADELGVELQLRSADSVPVFPPVPTTTQAVSGSTGQIIDLSWIMAIVLGMLLAIEIAQATAIAVRTRRDALPPKESAR